MNKYLKFFSSVQLALGLFIGSIILIFLGTIAQTEMDIFYAMDRYFYCFFVYKEISGYNIPIFLGGYFWGWALFINLSLATMFRIPWRKKKIGIHICHLGILLLLLGSFITSKKQIESHMTIREGETKAYSEENYNYELVFIDESNQDFNNTFKIDFDNLNEDDEIKQQNFNFTVKKKFANVHFLEKNSDKNKKRFKTTGKSNYYFFPIKEFTSDKKPNTPALVLQFNNQEVIIANVNEDFYDSIKLNDTVYKVQLRNKRHYYPFKIKLNDFNYDRYKATNIPKDFTSDITLIDGDIKQDYHIFMNSPLRYQGKTFFQSAFSPDEKGTILLVVDNISWTIPYIASIIVSLGLLIQFMMTLSRFLKKKNATNPISEKLTLKNTLAILLMLFILSAYFIHPIFKKDSAKENKLNYQKFSSLPVAYKGRLQPLDSLAKNTLLIFMEKTTIKYTPKGATKAIKILPEQWILEMLLQNPIVDEYKIFRITDPTITKIFDEKKQRILVSYNEINEKISAIHEKNNKKYAKFFNAKSKEEQENYLASISKEDKQYLDSLSRLRDKRIHYLQLKNYFYLLKGADIKKRLLNTGIKTKEAHSLQQENKPFNANELNKFISFSQDLQKFKEMYPLPILSQIDSNDETELISVEHALLDILYDHKISPSLKYYQDMLKTYQELLEIKQDKINELSNKKQEFNQILDDLHKSLKIKDTYKLELKYNKLDLPYKSTVIYVLLFIIICISWLFKPSFVLQKTIYYATILTFCMHLLSVILRVVISGYAPVTNLYSSALFAGLGSVFLALLIEKFFKNYYSLFAANLIGFMTGIIAYNLSLGGDTLEMLRAVLDSNFWLSTHVIIITIGYSSTYFAGGLGICLIFLKFFKKLSEDQAKNIYKAIYGLICFSALFSFVGTVLGGIWADQSWGRFWGWDPKENGALLIVIWHIFTLHALLIKWIKIKGLVICSIIGNIIVSLSWFGVNMLSVGLHAYGFTDKGMLYLSLFIASQIILIIIASLVINDKSKKVVQVAQ